MKRIYPLIAFMFLSATVHAQSATPSESKAIDPKEAFLNVSYAFKDRKITVMINDAAAYIENTSSTMTADTYTIMSLDGKTMIGTYTVERSNAVISLKTGDKKVHSFDLTEYISKLGSDLEKDAVKRKYPVYWLFKNGYKQL